MKLTAEPGEWLICFGDRVTQLSGDAHLLSMRNLHGWADGKPLLSGGPLHLLRAKQHPKLERLALVLLEVVERTAWGQEGVRDPRQDFLWKNHLDYITYLRYERVLLAWMTELARALMNEGRTIKTPNEIDPRIAKVFHFLDSIPLAAPYPERELVHTSGLSIGRLNRLSTQTDGFTTYGYWERRRIEQARLALQQPGVRVKEVAADLGFVQLSHFSAWFKRHTEACPRTYRTEKTGNSSLKGAGRNQLQYPGLDLRTTIDNF